MRALHRVSDLMSREPRCVGRNDSLVHADELMAELRVRHLPVVDDDGETLAGVLSRRDLFRGALARSLGYGEHAQHRLMAQLRVKDIMTNGAVTIAPDASLVEAARLMIERKIGSLMVVERSRLVGILTEGDFVRAYSEKARI